jgi:hypothetical protein
MEAQTQEGITAGMIQQALNNFFDRGGRLVRDEPVYVEEPEVIPEPKPEPSIHEMCKAQADWAFKNDEEVRKHYGLNTSSKKPSRKKSQPRPSVIVRAKSMHKLNPEEAVSRAW